MLGQDDVGTSQWRTVRSVRDLGKKRRGSKPEKGGAVDLMEGLQATIRRAESRFYNNYPEVWGSDTRVESLKSGCLKTLNSECLAMHKWRIKQRSL